MMKILDFNCLAPEEFLNRDIRAEEDVSAAVDDILREVRTRGDAALRGYTRRFDGAELKDFRVTAAEFDAAREAVAPCFLETLRQAAENIRRFHERQKHNDFLLAGDSGVVMGQRWTPIERVGICVPRSPEAFPSTILMSAIPAQIAGVEDIVIVTPPRPDGTVSPEALMAAELAEVTDVFKIGGAQAVAAVTYGAGFIPRVDKLVGPGNAYVAAAKRLAYGTLDIDMVAGPSEVLVIADETADPKFVAADLLSQAEHDKLASAVLLTDSMELAQAVDGEIVRQTGYLSRSEIMEASLRDFGCAIVCGGLDGCVELANEIAPEHLEIVTRAPRKLLPAVKNAGAVFLGAYTPEPLGDYLAGPDHVLPTSGTARFFSPLSVDSFLKSMSILEFGREALEPMSREIIALAQAEKLTAHANSVQVRFE